MEISPARPLPWTHLDRARDRGLVGGTAAGIPVGRLRKPSAPVGLGSHDVVRSPPPASMGRGSGEHRRCREASESILPHERAAWEAGPPLHRKLTLQARSGATAQSAVLFNKPMLLTALRAAADWRGVGLMGERQATRRYAGPESDRERTVLWALDARVTSCDERRVAYSISTERRTRTFKDDA